MYYIVYKYNTEFIIYTITCGDKESNLTKCWEYYKTDCWKFLKNVVKENVH